LTLPIQDWTEYVAVGERYHISAILGRPIIKKMWFMITVSPRPSELPRSLVIVVRLYTIVCGDVDLLVQVFYDNGHISS
jgi:hypothetical protein